MQPEHQIDYFRFKQVSYVIVFHYAEQHIKGKVSFNRIHHCIVSVQTHFCQQLNDSCEVIEILVLVDGFRELTKGVKIDLVPTPNVDALKLSVKILFVFVEHFFCLVGRYHDLARRLVDFQHVDQFVVAPLVFDQQRTDTVLHLRDGFAPHTTKSHHHQCELLSATCLFDDVEDSAQDVIADLVHDDFIVVGDQLYEAWLRTDIVLVEGLYDLAYEQLDPLCHVEFVPWVVHYEKLEDGVGSLLAQGHGLSLVHVLDLPATVLIRPVQDVSQCLRYAHLHKQTLFVQDGNSFCRFYVHKLGVNL